MSKKTIFAGAFLFLLLAIIGLFLIKNLRNLNRQGERQIRMSSKCLPGEIVVGFKKGIAAEEAEQLIKSYGLRFLKTDDVNMGKKFFYETGERYIVYVPPGAEEEWLEKFKRSKIVVQVGCHPDSKKVFVD